MKILVVTQYFYPENFRINDLVTELHERGHEVTILAGIPNYPQGKFYEGYSFFKRRREEYNGMPVIRAWMLPRRTGSLWLSLNYLSFVAGGCFKAKTMQEKDFDVIYAFGTSPITQALPAIAMKRRIKKPLIFNVQDLWPENVVVLTGLKNPFLLRLLNALVDHIYENCDAILGTSGSFVRRIQERPGVSNKEKVIFWPQYSVVRRDPSGENGDGSFGDFEELEEIRRDWDRERFNIVFTGNIGMGQGLSLVVEAASILKERNAAICFRLVGSGRDRENVRRLAREAGVEELVRFYDPVPEKYIPTVLAEAHAALIIMKPDPIFMMTIPAKFQTYLACGCAILGCVEGETRSLIREAGCGLCCEELTGKELAEKALELSGCGAKQLQEYREHAMVFSGENFDRDKILSRLEELMRCLH